MISIHDFYFNNNETFKNELLEYVELSLVIHSLHDGIYHTNNVLRINAYQKNIICNELYSKLNLVKDKTGFDTVESLLNDRRLKFIQNGYFNDGYTTNWLNRFFYLEAYQNILDRIRLIEDGEIIYTVESYLDEDQILSDEFFQIVITAFNEANRW